jgi:ABC-type glutathione transport system ATPase component
MSVKVIVDDLRKRYGAVEAARGVSFKIEEGEIFGLLGPNGAGKTTTGRVCSGLRQPDAGTIHICGIDARREPAKVKQRIGAAAADDRPAGQDHTTRSAGAVRHLLPSPCRAGGPTRRFALADKADVALTRSRVASDNASRSRWRSSNNPELVFPRRAHNRTRRPITA